MLAGTDTAVALAQAMTIIMILFNTGTGWMLMDVLDCMIRGCALVGIHICCVHIVHMDMACMAMIQKPNVSRAESARCTASQHKREQNVHDHWHLDLLLPA